ncbi:hypothetical protein RRG08_034362 [Elysia crispata]|uniref:Uncharacterized protein n=1 Tax=Elysia crispata TaxID=231223 RepID=A0AAE1CWM5_9GAST|nr:hypothetical protein RRG08_034362 [Elysia crispata]
MDERVESRVRLALHRVGVSLGARASPTSREPPQDLSVSATRHPGYNPVKRESGLLFPKQIPRASHHALSKQRYPSLTH